MFLYFSDWSQFLSELDRKGIHHGAKIIKVFSSPLDPRLTLEKPKLTIVESDGSFFKETFTYPERGTFTAQDLEDYLQSYGLNDLAKANTRALFRFANRADTEFCQLAMSAKKPDGGWFISHPMEDLDGLEMAGKKPLGRSMMVHLDVFYPRSLERLSRIVDFENSETLVGIKQAGRIGYGGERTF